MAKPRKKDTQETMIYKALLPGVKEEDCLGKSVFHIAKSKNESSPKRKRELCLSLTSDSGYYA